MKTFFQIIIFIVLVGVAVKFIVDDIKYVTTYNEWFFDHGAKEWQIVKEDNRYFPQYKGMNFGLPQTKDGLNYVISRDNDPSILEGISLLSFKDSLSAKKWIEGI